MSHEKKEKTKKPGFEHESEIPEKIAVAVGPGGYVESEDVLQEVPESVREAERQAAKKRFEVSDLEKYGKITTLRVHESTVNELEKLKRHLKLRTHENVVRMTLRYFTENSKRKGVVYTATRDLELMKQCSCGYRYGDLEWQKCGKRKTVKGDYKLETIKECVHCDDRIPKETFETRLLIAARRPIVDSKELGVRDRLVTKKAVRLQLMGNSYFSTCDWEDKYDDKKGFLVRSDKCPKKLKESDKDGWHPPEGCEMFMCPFLKPFETVKKDRAG